MRGTLSLALTMLVTALEVSAQTTPIEEAYPDKYPPALPARKGPPPPRFVFDLLGEVELPGPLPDGPLEVVDGKLRLAVAGGRALVTPGAGGGAEIDTEEAATETVPQDATADPEGWLVSEDGKMRFRIDADGRVLAQSRSSASRRRWHKEWTIKSPRGSGSPPLIAGSRLFYAGVDDRVYALRASNGHRLWAVDIGEPVSRPLVRWRCAIPVLDPTMGRVLPVLLDTLLVVSDGGGALRAFDLYDGIEVGNFTVPSGQGWLTSPPAVVDESHVAVARQGYVPEEAALTLLGPSAPENPTPLPAPAEQAVRQPPL